MSKGIGRTDIFFVSVQAILFGLYAFPFSADSLLGEVHSTVRIAAMVIAICGAIIVLMSMLQMKSSLSPFPSPKDTAALVVDGMFKYVRHPIYSGILLSAFSWAIASDCLLRFVLSLSLLVLFYFKSKYEEQLLVKRYGDYSEYRQAVGRFIPKL